MSLTLPKGLLLDLDDTILAFDAVADSSWIETLNTYTKSLHPVDAQALHQSIKATAAHFWGDLDRHRIGRLNLKDTRKQIVFDAMKALNLDDAGLASHIADTYNIIRTQQIHPVKGAIETLQYLREREIPLVLVTNGDAKGQREKIERFHLQQFFTAILIEGECGFGKPDERVYLRALDELGLPPEDVWMIGDNLEWEIVVPQQLGIRGIWVDYRGRGLPVDCATTPYRTISTLSDILEPSWC
ncbi:HAD family hydrolase [Alicyclobacillus fodiniaquatilis]|uniref:HAD family hydrolase n=1 Tax=Alicyclobacillus fodiniaquatilis TaxID=1661150 RepID=A0ABW4JHW6_9BACL